MPRFLMLLCAGLAAAASIGKLVPHVAWMADAFGVSLAAAGFLVSAVMLPGALLGPLLGLASDRRGARRVALFGLALQACASLAGGYAGSFGALLAARIAEGLGYGFTIVSATVLVFEGALRHRKALALAVWSAFAPVGFALGQLAAAGIAAANPLPLIGTAHALILGALAVALAIVVPEPPRKALERPAFLSALSFPPALRTALAFGLATGVLLGAVAVAPLSFSRAHDLSVAAAAQLTALAALPGIAGRFASGWFLSAAARPITIFVIASGLGSAALVGALLMPLALAAALACFTVFQICIGAVPGLLSAMLPQVVRSPGQLGTVSGLANQMVTTGNLLAPPVVLGVYAAAGVGAATALLVAVVALSAAMVAGLRVYQRPVTSATPP
jgi:predicted MFS family arabinose efflux permease